MANPTLTIANGNRIHHGGIAATYNAQDQLVQFGNNQYSYTKNGDEIEYLTDPSGRRIGKKINGTLKFGLIYQSDLRPAAQLNENGNLQSIFIYGDKGNVPSYMVRDGVNYRIISDHLGSVRMVINAETGQITQQMEYDVWGKVLSDTNPGFQPFGFAGGIYDADTGLVRFGARDYDAEIGRWTAKDPIGFNGGLNFYDYVGNDPVNRIDPEGLWWFGDPLPQGVVDAAVGFGDGVFQAITLNHGFGYGSNLRKIRQTFELGGDEDPCNGIYNGSNIAGNVVGGVALSGATWTKTLGPKTLSSPKIGHRALTANRKNGTWNTGKFRFGWSSKNSSNQYDLMFRYKKIHIKPVITRVNQP